MTRIRKTVITIVLLFMGLSAMAQNLVETVYLKNGSVIRGEIIEQIPNQSIKIKTKDGNIFVYNMDDVERIAKEEKPISNFNRLYKGMEYGIDLGVLISTISGGGSSFLAGINIGQRFNNNFYFGGGAGINLASGFHSFPVYINPRIYLPFENSKMDLFIDLKGGANFVTGYNSYQTGFAELLIGIQLPISSTANFNVGAGYLMDFYEGNTSGAIAIKTGIGFHSSTNSNYNYKEPVPTRNNGMQVTIEGGYGFALSEQTVEMWSHYGYGGETTKKFKTKGVGAVLLYKKNSHISLGGGLSLYHFDSPAHDYNAWENDYFDMTTIFKFFARGIYTFNENRISPIISLDMGVYHYRDNDGVFFNIPLPLISPSVGVSFRTTNNSYIEASLGYEWTCPQITNDKNGEPNGFIKEPMASWASMSNLYFKLGFTHTFKWGSK